MKCFLLVSFFCITNCFSADINEYLGKKVEFQSVQSENFYYSNNKLYTPEGQSVIFKSSELTNFITSNSFCTVFDKFVKHTTVVKELDSSTIKQYFEDFFSIYTNGKLLVVNNIKIDKNSITCDLVYLNENFITSLKNPDWKYLIAVTVKLLDTNGIIKVISCNKHKTISRKVRRRYYKSTKNCD